MLFSIKTCRLVALLSAHFTPAWGTWSAALKGKERTGTFPCLSAQPSGELMELHIQVLPGEVGLRQTSPVLPPGGGWGEETILICITGPIRCQSWCLLLGQRCSLMIGCNTEKNFVADFSTCGNLKRYFVNWQWDVSVYGKKLSLSKYVPVNLLCAELQAGKSLQEPSKLPVSLFLLCKERKNDLLPALPAVPFITREKPLTNGIPAGLLHPEGFRTDLTHLDELPLPLIQSKRPKLKWKLMCLLTSLSFMFVSFSLMHSELKNNNS